jgi:hypothetical protein
LAPSFSNHAIGLHLIDTGGLAIDLDQPAATEGSAPSTAWLPSAHAASIPLTQIKGTQRFSVFFVNYFRQLATIKESLDDYQAQLPARPA